MVRCSWLLAFATGILAPAAHAEDFILQTVFEKSDTSCGTMTRHYVEGVQNVCQRQGDAETYRMSSVTGKVYVKRTCNDSHVQTRFYSDPDCATSLADSGPDYPLACTYSIMARGNVMYTCGQSYTAARFSRYTDDTCKTKDLKLPEAIMPLDFCMVGGWEWDTKGKKVSCGKSGLETTMWENGDCTGKRYDKTDAFVGNTCAHNWYYDEKHVQVESGCQNSPSSDTPSTNDDKSSTSDGEVTLLSPMLSLGLVAAFSVFAC